MIDEAVRSGIAFSLAVLGLVVIFAPLIAERLRIPGLVGLLVGGALIGPNVLGVLDDFTSLERIGEMGILYLIFLAGLQLDRETFIRYRGISIGFGLITAAVSLVLGTAVALQLDFEARAAILIGSFWASFTLIAYPVLQQYDLSKNRAGAAVIGASAVTDTVSLLILAVTSSAVTLAANDSAIDDDFNFDLLAGVTLAEVCQRLATARTDLLVVRQVDLFLACW